MRVLVTGATGFLGAHVLPALLRAGHEPRALVRSLSSVLSEDVQQMEGDILNADSVRMAATGCDAVLHCAGVVTRDAREAEMLYRVHVEGTKKVLDACKEAGVRRAVVASTSGTIAISDDPKCIATESSPEPLTLIQKWPYYRSKLYAEKAALDRNRPDFEVLCINPTLLLGPGDLRGSSTEDVRLFLEGKVPFVPPGGLSFVDARDVADTMVSALTRGTAGARYLLGACNMTLREFFSRLSRVGNVRMPMVPVPRAPGLLRVSSEFLNTQLARFGVSSPLDPVSVEMSQYFWYLDATKAETELGFAPRDPQETLEATVRDLRERGVVWPAA
jgi:dihydroflavonol-4-reductase